MSEKKTLNEIHSTSTKKILRNSIEYVLNEKGLEKFTIKDICVHANVSIGTFYKYYKSKDDVIADRYEKIDNYFIQEVEPLMNDDVIDSLYKYTVKYAEYCENTSINISRQIFKSRFSMSQNFLINSERPLYRILLSIFKQGIEQNIFSDEMSYQKMSELYLVYLRGCSYDYVIRNGEYSFVDYIKENFKFVIKMYLK